MNTGSASQPVDHSVTADYSALFFLDFLGRYAVDRCGANDSVLTSLSSTVCILPIWIWISSFCLAFVKVELYWLLARYSLTLLTIFQLVLLFVYDTPPPVLGCGPNQAFPSPQIALSAYAYTIFLSYKKLRKVDYLSKVDELRKSTSLQDDRTSYARAPGKWIEVFIVAQYILVIHSVLWVGFASPGSAVAACVAGTVPAIALHQVMIVKTKEQGWLSKVVTWLETKLGVSTMNTLFTTIDMIEEEVDLLVAKTVPSMQPEVRIEPPAQSEQLDQPTSSPLFDTRQNAQINQINQINRINRINQNTPIVATGSVTMGYTKPN